jgi:hypothetical protein
MSKPLILFTALFFCLPFISTAQHAEKHSFDTHGQHEKMPHFRAAVFIGHTLIPVQGSGENFFIPSWGVDIEYWFTRQWAIGLHSDLEIETFVISEGEAEELERISPLVITIDALYRPWKGLVLQLGPGWEIEQEESFPLLRAGLEYEFELNHHWDISPTIFYDTRLSEYHTWTIALGVGKRF